MTKYELIMKHTPLDSHPWLIYYYDSDPDVGQVAEMDTWCELMFDTTEWSPCTQGFKFKHEHHAHLMILTWNP